MLTWLSRFSLVKADDYDVHEMGYDDETTTIRMSSRPKLKTTTQHAKTTVYIHVEHDEDYADVSHEEKEEEEDHIHHTTSAITKLSSTSTITVTTQVITEPPTTTTASSSSSTTRPTTHAITKLSSSTLGVTTQTITKIPVTYSTWHFTRIYNIDPDEFETSTLSPEQIAAYRAKIRRDRLLLKIFAIGVVVFMLSLSVAFIAIHLVRRKNRYNGYRTPANIPSSGHSTTFTNTSS
ncbi:unnamed protein product [Rotaria socialis]|nr:unnamed protein product [Rotaria socialis]